MGDASAVGCVGQLLVGTRGTNGCGEALVKIRGGSESYLAWSDEPLAKGTDVLVVHVRGPREVVVVPWTDPIAQLRSDQMPG
jgi:hypothetical protein